ncbi:alternative ribosome rescue aminoacyl-tRNA hydrolase ArfB [Lutibacter sp. TH_r2]|uniref:alternative ribosome rescue aminoacyl-tRNA hydrolase ArfB n=1 Tax=Lutibacter sp. TH_r2 TaxID=3082083 RepID=UPI0029530216|nr:alternative ribosome rescue aminoacyl-tRNA hydrolase ArfB [Lutibacter sp. TH_r2]MDV7186942.1 alternative ribosome rescue aminoacyl-tRNA hydrolase ArfB [Lutibacter sp. TH_r2]
MNSEIIIHELNFKAVRSSGAGGQHVNKVFSKIELFYNIEDSNGLSSEEKELLLKKLANKLSKDNTLILTCSESRSQHKNKELAIKKLFKLLKKSLIQPKKRKATKPSKSSIRKRLEKKKKQAYKKAFRRKPSLE